MPDDESRRFTAQGQEIQCDSGYIYYEPMEPIEHVYFPLNGVASVITPMKEGHLPDRRTRFQVRCGSRQGGV